MADFRFRFPTERRTRGVNTIAAVGKEQIIEAALLINSIPETNTNTNYNSDAEEKAGKYGMLELTKVLKDELEKS